MNQTMIQTVRLAVVATTLWSAASSKASDASRSEAGLAARDAYLNYLLEDGYKAELDQYGDIKVRIEGKNYFIAAGKGDATYLHMNTGVIFKETADMSVVLKSANASNLQYGLPKAYVNGRTLRFGVAAIVLRPEDFRVLFPKLVSQLQMLQSKFRSVHDAELAAQRGETKPAPEPVPQPSPQPAPLPALPPLPGDTPQVLPPALPPVVAPQPVPVPLPLPQVTIYG